MFKMENFTKKNHRAAVCRPVIFLFFLFNFWSILATAQPGEKIYRGLRISLYGFKITEQTEKAITVKCNAVNTGREPVVFGKGKYPPDFLVVELDTLTLPKPLASRAADLTKSFFREKINLTPGQFLSNLSLKIYLDSKDEPVPQTEIEPEILTEKKPEIKTEKTSLPKISTEKQAEKSPEKIEPPVVQVIEKQEVVEGKCMDLVFDTAYIVEQKPKQIILHFAIRNAGDRTANLFGKTDHTDDNLAINAYFVTGSRLTRGAFLAETIFYKDKSLPAAGKLAPGAIFEGRIDISTKNRTKFNPNLILEIDPFQTLPDCDNTNNTKSILATEK